MRVIRESSDRVWVYWERRDGVIELDTFPRATVVVWSDGEDAQPKRGARK